MNKPRDPGTDAKTVRYVHTFGRNSSYSALPLGKTVRLVYVSAMKDFAELIDRAMDQHALISLSDAEELGIPAYQIRRWTYQGLLTRLSQGVYRVEAVAGDQYGQLQAGVFWPRHPDAILVGESALDLHDLCTNIPQQVHVAVPLSVRIRRSIPGYLSLTQRDIPPHRRTMELGLPVVTIPQAIIDAVALHLGDRFVEEALDAARSRRALKPSDEVEIAVLREKNLEVARLPTHVTSKSD